jgi:CBS domain-containing protein
LDGGRIVRAMAWKVTGDRDRAAAIAAGAGQVLGALLVAVGFFELFFVPGAFTDGLWLAVLGWFLGAAANAERAAARLRRSLAGRPLRHFASRVVDPVPADATVDDAIDRWFHVFDREAFFVAEEPAGPLIGVVTVDDVRRVPPGNRDRVSVRDIMRPIESVPWLDAGTPASAVLDRLEGDGVAVVFEDGEPVGLVTWRDVVGHLRRDEQLGRVPAGAGRSR